MVRDGLARAIASLGILGGGRIPWEPLCELLSLANNRSGAWPKRVEDALRGDDSNSLRDWFFYMRSRRKLPEQDAESRTSIRILRRHFRSSGVGNVAEATRQFLADYRQALDRAQKREDRLHVRALRKLGITVQTLPSPPAV